MTKTEARKRLNGAMRELKKYAKKHETAKQKLYVAQQAERKASHDHAVAEGEYVDAEAEFATATPAPRKRRK